MSYTILGNVGKGGENLHDDIVSTKSRLNDLGYKFFEINGTVDPGFIMAIRLFQSIIAGKNRIGGVDGRIDVGGFTNRHLKSAAAPIWQIMPEAGPGFFNYERQDSRDQHDYGTSWLADTLIAAGARYNQDFLDSNLGAALLTVNDVSLPWGGDTPDHAGHETGMACDIRLPRKDGKTGGISNPNTNGAYDRDAMRAQLVALREQPLFSRAFFNDKKLIDEGLCSQLSGHNNHLHFEITAPKL